MRGGEAAGGMDYEMGAFAFLSLFINFFTTHEVLGEVQIIIWSCGFIVWTDCVLVLLRNTGGQPSETSDDHPLEGAT